MSHDKMSVSHIESKGSLRKNYKLRDIFSVVIYTVPGPICLCGRPCFGRGFSLYCLCIELTELMGTDTWVVWWRLRAHCSISICKICNWKHQVQGLKIWNYNLFPCGPGCPGRGWSKKCTKCQGKVLKKQKNQP